MSLEDIKNGQTFQKRTPLNLGDVTDYSKQFLDERDILIKNNPINFTNETDLNTDPITFSLLLDKDVFTDFIKNTDKF
jgi:hypothetical protein